MTATGERVDDGPCRPSSPANGAAAGSWGATTTSTPPPRTAKRQRQHQLQTSAAAVAEPAVTKPDDLTKLSGIGPRIEVILAEGGVNTYAKLAHTTADRAPKPSSLPVERSPPASLRTWPAQAAFAAKGDWEGLAKYNKRHQK